MPELTLSTRQVSVAAGANLLDALLAAGIAVSYSCRAGSCHACLVRCVRGEPADAKPAALEAAKRADGWRLACQCSVTGDLALAVFDPRLDAQPAHVSGLEWLAPGILHLQLQPVRPLRYRAGQHVVLWLNGIARPYSLASLPDERTGLSIHLDCRQPGAFADAARQLVLGDALGLGEVHGGALRYDPEWQGRPLWLLAAGTGLAPLYAVLCEALRQGHEGPIELLHCASQAYWAGPLDALVASHPNVRWQAVEALPRSLRLSRQSIALTCGSPASVEAFARALFMAGVPRSQVFSDLFSPRH